MKNDLSIMVGVIIPSHELEITTSRAGGPGGQHVNKTNSRVTVRWNVMQSSALNNEQKYRVLEKLQTALTGTGDLVVHAGTHRSQEQNKQHALNRLADAVRNALIIPKKRIPTRATQSAREARLHHKLIRGRLKKSRSSFNND